MIGVEFYKFGSNISKHDRYNGQGAILSLNFSRQKQGGKRKEGQTHFGSLGAFSISRTINTSLGIPCHAAPISLPLLPLLSFHPASPIFFSRSRPATNRLSSASHPNNSSFQRALSMPPLASRDAVSTSIISTNHPPRDCIPPTNQNAIYIYIFRCLSTNTFSFLPAIPAAIKYNGTRTYIARILIFDLNVVSRTSIYPEYSKSVTVANLGRLKS